MPRRTIDNEDRAVPAGDVYAFAAMDTFWRRLVAAGTPQVRGFFCVGECGSAVRTSGSYVSTRSSNGDFVRIWETTLRLDRTARRRFERAVLGQEAPLRERAVDGFVNEAVKTGALLDADMQRAVMSGYHGMTGMDAWTRRPGIWWRILLAQCTALEHRGFLDRQRERLPRAAFR